MIRHQHRLPKGALSVVRDITGCRKGPIKTVIKAITNKGMGPLQIVVIYL